MKIEFVFPTEDLLEERDHRAFYNVNVDGKRFMSFSDGEPEDANLSRDFNDIYNIYSLLKKVIEATKNGEEIILEDRQISEEY